jgi:hypothetical protein
MMRNVNKAKDLGVEDVVDKPESFQDIQSVRELVNPRLHPESHDAHMATLQHHGISRLTDQQLLSRLVKGFFGGWVFAPEAKVLAFMKPGDRPYTSESCEPCFFSATTSNKVFQSYRAPRFQHTSGKHLISRMTSCHRSTL